MSVPTKRKDAIYLGHSTYYTHVPCKQGHVVERYASTGACVECARLAAARQYDKWRVKIRAGRKVKS